MHSRILSLTAATVCLTGAAHAASFVSEDVLIEDEAWRLFEGYDDSFELSVFAKDSIIGAEYLLFQHELFDPDVNLPGSVVEINESNDASFGWPVDFSDFAAEITDGSIDAIVFEVKAPAFLAGLDDDPDENFVEDALEDPFEEVEVRIEASLFNLFGETDFAGFTIDSIFVSVREMDVEWTERTGFFQKGYDVDTEIVLGMEVFTSLSGGPQGDTSVPEPATYGLLGAGVLAALIVRRRIRQA